MSCSIPPTSPRSPMRQPPLRASCSQSLAHLPMCANAWQTRVPPMPQWKPRRRPWRAVASLSPVATTAGSLSKRTSERNETREEQSREREREREREKQKSTKEVLLLQDVEEALPLFFEKQVRYTSIRKHTVSGVRFRHRFNSRNKSCC